MRKDEAKVKKNYISEHRKNAEFVQMEEDVNDSFMKKMDEMRQEISEQVENLKMECMNTCENVNLLIEKMHDSDEKFLKVGSFKEETDNKFRMLDEKVTAKMDAASSNAVFKMLYEQLELHSKDFKTLHGRLDLHCEEVDEKADFVKVESALDEIKGRMGRAEAELGEVERKLVPKLHDCFEKLRKAMNLLCTTNYEEMGEALMELVDKYLENKLSMWMSGDGPKKRHKSG